MIFFDDDTESVEQVAFPDTLSVAEIMERSSEEMGRVADLLMRLEDTLLSIPEATQNAAALSALQSVDLMQQSVNGLALFFGALTDQAGAWDVEVQDSLRKVPLEAMRNRLGLGTAPVERQTQCPFDMEQFQ